MAGNPLVVESEGPGAFAGAGLVGDIASLTSDNDAWDYSVDGISTGLDAIGAAMDPFGAIASAGVGWLLQHVSFLREPIDKLTGDASGIQAMSETWANIARQLGEAGAQYSSALNQTSSWSGDAADHYRTAAKELIAAYEATAEHSQHASEGMMAAGIIVGTERGIIYDMLSTFIGRVIVEALAALASSWFTLGGSIAAFVAAVDIDASIQAERFSMRIAALMKKIGQFAQKFTTMGGKAETLAKDLETAGKRINSKAGSSLGRKKGWKTNATKQHWYQNTPRGSLINASNKLEHSPLNNVHDVTDSATGRTVREGGRQIDEHHKHDEHEAAEPGGDGER